MLRQSMSRYVAFLFLFSMNISYLIFSCCNIIFASRWTRMKVEIERDTHETLLGVLQKKDTWHLVTTSSRGNPQAKTSERTKTKQLLDRHECPSARVQRARSNTPRCARPRILASNRRLFNNRPRPAPRRLGFPAWMPWRTSSLSSTSFSARVPPSATTAKIARSPHYGTRYRLSPSSVAR